MVKLSASRIKTLFNCSYLYFSQYILKIPDESNSGAARGSVSHSVLECLLRPDRRWLVDKIKEVNNPFASKAVKRMARMLAKKYGVWNEEDFEMIRNFILVALKLDFFMEGAEVEAEYEFNIKTDSWHAGGFVDKVGVYPDRIQVVDYKTSKKKFAKDELSFNLQNYFYTYAVQQKYPGVPVSLQFQFLKFPKDPIQDAPQISEGEMKGFIEWLKSVGEFLSSFTLAEGLAKPAKDDIKTRWLCGKPAGSLKADGSPAFTCKFRSPFLYFELVEDGKTLKTSRSKEELDRIKKDGQEVVQKSYLGCPFYKNEWAK